MVNLPIKQSKTVFHSTTVTFYGIEVDTVNQTFALAPNKVAYLRQKLINLAKRKKTTLKEMQSLIGSLNFACRAIAPGRAFLRRLIDLTRGKIRANHRIRITVEAHRDMSAWLEFLHAFNGQLSFLPTTWMSSDVLHLTTDASGFAYGAVVGASYGAVVGASYGAVVGLHMGLSWGLHGCRVGFPLHVIPSIFLSKNSCRSYWLSGAGGQYGLINVSCFFQITQ